MDEKMEKGVYLPSPNQDSTLMIRCLQVLLNTYPFIKFNSIEFDVEARGYKIRFAGQMATVLLQENYLTVDGEKVWIYPLTAFLTIRSAFRDSSKIFQSEVKGIIENKFGKLLSFEKMNESADALTEDWRAQVDVPEFKGLFSGQDIFPDLIPIPSWNQNLEVTFWCRHCEKSGHFQHQCQAREGSNDDETQKNSGIVKSETKIANLKATEKNVGGASGNSRAQSNSKSPPATKKFETAEEEGEEAQSNSKSTTKKRANTIQEHSKISKYIDTCAEKIGRETVMNSGILSEGSLNLRQTKTDEPPSNSAESKTKSVSTGKEIKKENGVHADDGNEERSGNSGGHVVPKEEPPTSPFHTNEDSLNNSLGHYSNDDEIQIVGSSTKSSPLHIPSHDSNTAGRDGAYNSEDASMSPTNIKSDYSFPSFSETKPSTMTPSSSNRTSSSAKPVTRVEVTSALSDRLQECINDACDTCNVLNRKTLDAFLIHVKKKSNPVRVALNFTKNSSGLKDQLQQILHLYYNTPQTGTKEDMQFIKWLNGLVDRFDGTVPRKRKRNDRSEESPTKK